MERDALGVWYPFQHQVSGNDVPQAIVSDVLPMIDEMVEGRSWLEQGQPMEPRVAVSMALPCLGHCLLGKGKC